MAIKVRPAGRDDREAVKQMLAEFIDYLNAIEPSEGEADLDYLVDQSFGPDPVCKTLIAESGGRPVGYVGFHPGSGKSGGRSMSSACSSAPKPAAPAPAGR